jgi:5-methylcytosine-specific restriction protein B
MPDALDAFAGFIAAGLSAAPSSVAGALAPLFGLRYHKRHWDADASKNGVRDAYRLADGDGAGVPFGALLHPDNPSSGAYGGFSLAWFPADKGGLISLVVGTRGLQPDEGILTRPGHRRRVASLRRYLARKGVACWSKADPAAISTEMPMTARAELAGTGNESAAFLRAMDRYASVLYCVARVPSDNPALARTIVAAFLDLYSNERGWNVSAPAKPEVDAYFGGLRADLFPTPGADEVYSLLMSRRFVVLQGPPGTGKTRLAEIIKRTRFDSRGPTVQFHPAVTYEDFVVGLSPQVEAKDLNFRVKEGWLLDALKAAEQGPTLLVIDEVNRADLGKVLGEAIYLFESGEVGAVNPRVIRLPHAVNGLQDLKFSPNLYVLATMNTADRSIAGMDLAVRRRFAFVTMMPDRAALAAQNVLPQALKVFDDLSDVFVEFAPDEALDLMPGHSYFFIKDEEQLKTRLRYELLPLVDEYLRQGFLSQATSELMTVRDRIEDMCRA